MTLTRMKKMDEVIDGFKKSFLEKRPFYEMANKRDGSHSDLVKAIESYIKRFCLLIDSRYADSAEIKRIVDSQNESIYSFDITDIDSMYEIAKEIHAGRKKGCILSPDIIKERVINLYEKEIERGIEMMGFGAFSSLYRFKHGQMNIITGVPTHGKSEWLDEMLVNYVISNRMKFAIFSPENYPIELHIVKIASKFFRKSFFGHLRMSRIELDSAIDAINNHFFFIEPHEDSVNLESVLSLVEKCHEEHKIDGFVIDPWNELEHNIPTGKTEVQYIGQALTTLRRFGRSLNISPFIVAHPTKLKPNKPGEPTPVPQAYDINGGAMWYNKADNIICVYRNQDNTVDIHVQKIKFKHYGKKGTTSVVYNTSTGCYDEKTCSNR